MKSKIDKFFNIIADIAGGVVVILLGVLVSSVLIQIGARLFFQKATPWTEELARYMQIWVCFAGSVRVLVNKDHMIVDFLCSKYRGNTRKVASLLIYLIELAFFAFLLYYGATLCTKPVVVNARTSALRISKLYIYAVIPLSMALNALYAFYGMILNVIAIVRPGKDDEQVLCFAYDETSDSGEEGEV